MKKGEIYEGIVERLKFPNKGVLRVGDARVTVKNTLPGQRVRFAVSKKKGDRIEGRLLEVVERSPVESDEAYCPHFGECGGCSYQTLPYEEQLRLKEGQIRELLEPVIIENGDKSIRYKDSGERSGVAGTWGDIFEGILPSPGQFEYRNKMEFTFGDEVKDGPLVLGLHKRGSMYDIVEVDCCRIVDEDYRRILAATADYFREAGVSFYHRMRHEGYLRHLLVRKAARTGEILVDLVTSSQISVFSEKTTQSTDITGHGDIIAGVAVDACNFDGTGVCRKSDDYEKNKRITGDLRINQPAIYANIAESEEKLLQGWMDRLLLMPLDGILTGILHTRNNSLSDAVKDEGTEILYGQDYFYEELLGLRFRITPFSFFQTNSLGAEVLYDTVRRFIRESLDAAGESLTGKTVFDLYSGTGTIAQMLSPVAGKVIGVEIVEEAVEAARENAALNGLTNCEFIAGDVLKVLDAIPERPDFIVLDPPRDGIHPKALKKIIDYGVERMIYISCKPTSLARDLAVLQDEGYRAERICCVDMFPDTVHVETIVLMSRAR